MPNMNGLEFLEKIMRLRPMPVVMVSTLTQAGAEVTLAALELGAVDCVGKPVGGVTAQEAFADLAEKVKAAARARVRPLRRRRRRRVPRTTGYRAGRDQILAIGSSTGGVEALMTILSAFPANCPPTVITQHMPATFTKSFAERLDRVSARRRRRGPSTARRWCPATSMSRPAATPTWRSSGGRPPSAGSRGDPVNGHRPSVDVLFHSVAALRPPPCGVILTGMGRDGAQGLLAMRQAGARTLGQDEASLRRLRHAARRLRTGRRRAPAAAAPDRPRHPQSVRRLRPQAAEGRA